MSGEHRLDGHLITARLENADFLLRTGLQVDQVAARLGVTSLSLVKTFDREVGPGEWRQRYPATRTPEGEGP